MPDARYVPIASTYQQTWVPAQNGTYARMERSTTRRMTGGLAEECTRGDEHQLPVSEGQGFAARPGAANGRWRPLPV